MRLLRLELGGFKSFAKNTILEFPHAITAVVGPNGSGKSNVADAVRWVLGEQSIKSLRGKRGEDLIFAGTASAPRLSKAGAFLVFDNSAREFPLEFKEVSIGRRVYRDGLNDYLLNGSQVRLKNIIELLARVGFGSSQHHIIGQGEADRILYASPKERREMIEDALGLKIFQIKRADAERKLEYAEENMQQVASLQKEIQPHLKFLKVQAEKFEIASKLREELKLLLYEYLSKKSADMARSKKELGAKRAGPSGQLEKLNARIKECREKIEKGTARKGENEEEKALSSRLKELLEARAETERELGKLEGMIELAEKDLKAAKDIVVSKKEIEDFLAAISKRLEELEVEDVLTKILLKIRQIREALGSFLRGLKGERPEREENLNSYRAKFEESKSRLESVKAQELKSSKAMEEKALLTRREAEEWRREEKRLYEFEREATRVKDELRTFEVEAEKIRFQEEDFKRECEEARPYLGEITLAKQEGFASGEEADAMRKKIERTKIKLEEAGGIDPAVLKEYQEVSRRHEFLSKESEDLIKSAAGLRQLIAELEEKLEHDFKEGVLKINAEFEKFFKLMFGGGKASLKVILASMRKKAREEGEEEGLPAEAEEAEAGIEISVDLPRKRIKSLDMLSGGERALTSIALLFAMSAVHPPPFLVLDETDAALDEANSQRYAKMLEDLSKTAQLIVITHNRATMKCAGVLYGVTMGSDGISKLLSLKFEEAGALVS